MLRVFLSKYGITLIIALIILIIFVKFYIQSQKPNVSFANNSKIALNTLKNFPSIEFNKQDRVLVIAPHPDDESLATSSVILKAKSAGATVKVLFVTFGEHNTLTLSKFFIAPTPFTADLLAARRGKEAINAAKTLGLSEKDLIFFGFPDFGTLKIWDDHFTNKPYFSGLILRDKALYNGVYKKGALFTAEEELTLFEEVILSYKPTKIFYPSTLDLNPDHRATGLFTEAALFDLKDKIHPELYTYFVHSEDWPEPVGYFPNEYLTPPKYFVNITSDWLVSYLSNKEEFIKLKAVKAHLSQYWTKPKFMASFVRKNELFFSTTQYQINSNLPLWTKEEMEKLKITPYVKNVSITEDANSYEFNIALHKGFPVFTKMILFIYPEIKGKPFLEAPKYKLVIERGISGNISFILFDRGKPLEFKKDSISHRISDLVFKIKMDKSHFNNCSGFFFSVYIEEVESRISETPWWLINLEKP